MVTAWVVKCTTVTFASTTTLTNVMFVFQAWGQHLTIVDAGMGFVEWMDEHVLVESGRYLFMDNALLVRWRIVIFVGIMIQKCAIHAILDIIWVPTRHSAQRRTVSPTWTLALVGLNSCTLMGGVQDVEFQTVIFVSTTTQINVILVCLASFSLMNLASVDYLTPA